MKRLFVAFVLGALSGCSDNADPGVESDGGPPDAGVCGQFPRVVALTRGAEDPFSTVRVTLEGTVEDTAIYEVGGGEVTFNANENTGLVPLLVPLLEEREVQVRDPAGCAGTVEAPPSVERMSVEDRNEFSSNTSFPSIDIANDGAVFFASSDSALGGDDLGDHVFRWQVDMPPELVATPDDGQNLATPRVSDDGRLVTYWNGVVLSWVFQTDDGVSRGTFDVSDASMFGPRYHDVASDMAPAEMRRYGVAATSGAAAERRLHAAPFDASSFVDDEILSIAEVGDSAALSNPVAVFGAEFALGVAQDQDLNTRPAIVPVESGSPQARPCNIDPATGVVVPGPQGPAFVGTCANGQLGLWEFTAGQDTRHELPNLELGTSAGLLGGDTTLDTMLVLERGELWVIERGTPFQATRLDADGFGGFVGVSGSLDVAAIAPNGAWAAFATRSAEGTSYRRVQLRR